MYAIRSYYVPDDEQVRNLLDSLRGGEGGAEPGSGLSAEEDAPAGPAADAVITSYSIHYTKLYEI